MLGLGGTESLAHALARSELGRSFHAEDFWVTVIHFFINNPGIPERDIHAIVDYLAVQKFAPRFATIGDDVDVCLGPAQPDLTMKGRTASSLLRQVARWWKERDDRSNPARVLLTWDRSSFGGYTQVDEDGKTWTIRELLDSAALVDEGRSMEHCVATYAGQCLRRAATIWSLGIEGDEGRRRVLTIDVNPATCARSVRPRWSTMPSPTNDRGCISRGGPSSRDWSSKLRYHVTWREPPMVSLIEQPKMHPPGDSVMTTLRSALGSIALDDRIRHERWPVRIHPPRPPLRKAGISERVSVPPYEGGARGGPRV